MNEQPQIILVDNLKVRKINLQIGENIIGNDPNYASENESALEQAVKINVSDDGEISITPYEGISCYMKSYGSLRWTLLKPNESETLRLRDTCLLYPIKIWFRVISAMEVISENSKRKMEQMIEDEPPDKKYCSEYNREVECLNDLNNNSNELNVNDCINSSNKYENGLDKCENNDISDVLQALDSHELDQPEMYVMIVESEKLKHCNEPNVHEQNELITNVVPAIDSNENSDKVQCNTDQGIGDQLNNSDLIENQQKNNDNATPSSNEDNVVQCNTDPGVGDQINNSDLTEKQQDANNQQNNDSTTSTNNQDNTATANTNLQTIPREKCKYGSQCCRSNAEHKAKFSHVGDDDYDVPDNRPECPHGTNCYQKNLHHKQHCNHSHSKRQAAVNSVRNMTHQDSDSDQSIQESVYESDNDQSFIDDDDIESLEEFESDFDEGDDDGDS